MWEFCYAKARKDADTKGGLIIPEDKYMALVEYQRR
jgi:hypothetical protein